MNMSKLIRTFVVHPTVVVHVDVHVHSSAGDGAPMFPRIMLPWNMPRSWSARILVLVLATLAAYVGQGTSTARAAGFAEIGSFGEGGSEAGQLSGPRDVAVNDATHDVYVADTGNNRVEEFAPSGAFVLVFGKEVNATKKTNVCTQVEIEAEAVVCKAGEAGSAAGEAVFSEPSGIAVDNSGGVDEGDVYVADTGNDRVEVFDSSGAWITEFNGKETPERSFSSPWGLAVDGNGDVYVDDHFHFVLDKFSPLGLAYIASPYLTGLTSPTQVAVDSNTGNEAIYIRQRFTNIAKFNYSTGASEGEVDAGEQTQDVAVNTVTNDVYVSEKTQVSEYQPGGPILIEPFGTFPPESETSIAVDSSTGTVYVVLHESDKVEVFSSTIVLPTVVAGPASAQKASATVEGEINPNGVAVTECRFEYGTTTKYGQQPLALCSHPSASEVGAGTSAVKVSAQLNGLTPNQTYHYRLVAGNASASNHGGDGEFTTRAVPAVDNQPPSASGVTRTSALLVGTVNPENSPTKYHFEYGTTTAYGSTTEEASAGSGIGDISVGPQALAELQPETTYHYRLVATNEAAGSETGPDFTFTTGSRTPPLVDTGEASGVTQAGVTISGIVDSRGIETSYTFEVGTDTSYSGAKVFGGAGQGEGAESIAVALEDLAPGTTYHYRLTATNADGTSYGQDMAFTTPGVPSPITQPLTLPLLATPTIAFPTETGTTTTAIKALTRAQKLAAALKTCRKKVKGKRAGCEKRAREQYPSAKAGAKRKHNSQKH